MYIKKSIEAINQNVRILKKESDKSQIFKPFSMVFLHMLSLFSISFNTMKIGKCYLYIRKYPFNIIQISLHNSYI